VIVVAGRVEGIAVVDAARLARKPVPSRLSLPILKGRPLNLRSGGGNAPGKVFGKSERMV